MPPFVAINLATLNCLEVGCAIPGFLSASPCISILVWAAGPEITTEKPLLHARLALPRKRRCPPCNGSCPPAPPQDRLHSHAHPLMINLHLTCITAMQGRASCTMRFSRSTTGGTPSSRLFQNIYILSDRCVVAQGKPQDAIPKLKQDWKDAIIANWKLWPFFQFVNFRFVPPEQRVRACETSKHTDACWRATNCRRTCCCQHAYLCAD